MELIMNLHITNVKSDIPYRVIKVYRCKKCGYSKKYKVEENVYETQV